ncbi:MAG TPA: hypothetical protein VH703_05155 [Solirubrobacterales bacterium]|jgi:hypothetical protein
MNDSRDIPQLPFSGPPSRLPGQSEVELEPVAGDIQLVTPSLLSKRRQVGTAKATERERRTLYRPRDRVPVSGVYDIVDIDGRYLGSQITCHEGREFPPTQSHFAREADVWAADEPGPHYGYKLAYEALHLQPPPPRDRKIYRPGERVKTSAVYDVVDLDGEYLLHQRACVEGERFPQTEGPEPGSYGYRLEYPAKHLTHD